MSSPVFTNQPLDQPGIIAPGVKRKESDWPGAGKHVSLPPEHPLRAEKGDLGMVGVPAPRASVESNVTSIAGSLMKPGTVRRRKGK